MGSVNRVQRGANVTLVARLTGVPPGEVGFHVHDKGDCSAPDGMGAGGQFNPAGKPHGNPANPDHHAGDMQMLEADAEGNATMDAILEGVTLGGGDPLDNIVVAQ